MFRERQWPYPGAWPESLPGRSYDVAPSYVVLRTPMRGGRPHPGDLPPFLLAHRWPERGSTGWQLRHEGVAAVEGGVEGAVGDGEVGGEGPPRHVGPATSVHRDVEAPICPEGSP
jgi:hypothetical protein